MKKSVIIIVALVSVIICIGCLVLGIAFIQGVLEGASEAQKEDEDERITQVLIEQSFGSYEIPSNWYEDTEFVAGAFSYIKNGTKISEPFNSVTVLTGSNKYTAEEHELFRDAIVEQLTSTLSKDQGATLEAEGVMTDQGYHCYIFEIKYPSGEYQKQAYIVGENRYCQVDEMNLKTGEESDEVFQGILDSYIWKE